MSVSRRSINGYHRQIRPQITTLPAKSGSLQQDHGSLEAINSKSGKRVQIPSSGYMEYVSAYSLTRYLDALVTNGTFAAGCGKTILWEVVQRYV